MLWNTPVSFLSGVLAVNANINKRHLVFLRQTSVLFLTDVEVKSCQHR